MFRLFLTKQLFEIYVMENYIAKNRRAYYHHATVLRFFMEQ